MYAVKFIRADGLPDEIYYYTQKEDAEYHLHLFDHDDSGLYTDVVLGEIMEHRSEPPDSPLEN